MPQSWHRVARWPERVHSRRAIGITGSRALDTELSDLLRAVARAARIVACADDVEGGLARALCDLGAAVHADRALLMPVHGSGLTANDFSFSVTYEWIAAGSDAKRIAVELGQDPVPFVGPEYDFTRRLELLSAGKPVVYGSVRALPGNETALAQKLGTRSSVRIPVVIGGRLVAMLGLDHTRTVWPWRPEELFVLWLLGDVVARATTHFVTFESRPGPPDSAGMSDALQAWVNCGASLFRTLDFATHGETILAEFAMALGFLGAQLVGPDAGTAPAGDVQFPVHGRDSHGLGWLRVQGAGASHPSALVESFAELLGAAVEAEKRAKQ